MNQNYGILSENMHPLLGKALLRVVLFHGFGLLVAWVFTLIESHEESRQLKMKRLFRELRAEIPLKYKVNMSDIDFESFLRKASAGVTAGEELDWTFMNSCAYVFAAFTTIGYGHITPKTSLGRGVTINACLLGIPITMLAFKTLGELCATFFRFLVIKTETILFRRVELKHLKKKTFFVACVLLVVLMILASVSTIFLEHWTFMEGLYAWFTTFTTIGFGDYVLFRSYSIKLARGDISTTSLLLKGLVFVVPYAVGLSLMSCILTCLVDSVDQIRHFRDRCWSCCPSLIFDSGNVCRYDVSRSDTSDGRDREENEPGEM
ncbi:potassium channel subfamily K member 3-like [Stylophora pistillata]|uniref:potassium channel subfamily K member 3-like n=1 Tax=Stylophora pistillata TaxID=50429 RepID=UPI000C043114|nr:potassium channel subfamily K member 3-like [Stylophora pistillata]